MRGNNVATGVTQRTLQLRLYYCQVLLKNAYVKYLKLDYYLRFSAILSDVNMYIPKIFKNKIFKQNVKTLKDKINHDCLELWGIQKQRDILHAKHCLPTGQLLVMNDNPTHMWYNLSAVCKHEDGFEIIHSQTRCNDEMISSFKFCKKCSRHIL